MTDAPQQPSLRRVPRHLWAAWPLLAGLLLASPAGAQDAAASAADGRVCQRALLHVATLPDVDPRVVSLTCREGVVHVDGAMPSAASWERLRDSLAELEGVRQVQMATARPEPNDEPLAEPSPLDPLWLAIGTPATTDLQLPEPESEESLHRAASGDRPRTYTVQAGDSLSRIASKTMDDGNAWLRLYEFNRSVIGPNPDGLREGMVLRVPQD